MMAKAYLHNHLARTTVRLSGVLLFLLVLPGLIPLLPAPLSHELAWLGEKQAHAAISFVQTVGQTSATASSTSTSGDVIGGQVVREEMVVKQSR